LPENKSASSKIERDHLDCIAKNIIVSVLDYDELLKVSKCILAKEMWDTLEKYHKNPRSAWLDKEESSVDSSSSETKMEICLMAKEESGSNQVSTSSSNKCENYFQLLDAFQETHEEAKRLTLSNNRLKSENNRLKEKIKFLENDLNNSNADFKNLELIYQNSSCKCDSSFYKNCESSQKKVLYLVKNVDTISKGKSNLEDVLASQKCVFGKSGLGFNPQSKNSGCSKPFSTITKNQSVKRSKQPVVCCFYYMKKGHSVRFCRIRKFSVPKGILKWVPKNPKVPWKHINASGPKFIRGPDLAT